MDSQLSEPPNDTMNSRPPARVLSGRSLVIGMLLMGISATVVMFIYWDQHTRPFRSLREAIGREFRHSRPNVEGGRHKGRGPRMLRISMSVDFPPAEDTTHANDVFQRVLEITRQIQDMREFDKIEVNLIQIVPEELAKVKTFTWSPQDDGESSSPDQTQ